MGDPPTREAMLSTLDVSVGVHENGLSLGLIERMHGYTRDVTNYLQLQCLPIGQFTQGRRNALAACELRSPIAARPSYQRVASPYETRLYVDEMNHAITVSKLKLSPSIGVVFVQKYWFANYFRDSFLVFRGQAV